MYSAWVWFSPLFLKILLYFNKYGKENMSSRLSGSFNIFFSFQGIKHIYLRSFIFFITVHFPHYAPFHKFFSQKTNNQGKKEKKNKQTWTFSIAHTNICTERFLVVVVLFFYVFLFCFILFCLFALSIPINNNYYFFLFIYFFICKSGSFLVFHIHHIYSQAHIYTLWHINILKETASSHSSHCI